MRYSGFSGKSGQAGVGAGTIVLGCVGAFICAAGAAVLVFVSLFSGGDEPSSRSKIADYVEKNCAISGFTVNSEPLKTVCSDDCKAGNDHTDHYDYVWTVTEADGTQFKVRDYYYYSNAAFSGNRRKVDNYNSVHALKYLRQADCRGFILRGDVNDFYNGIWLEGGFADRRELRALVDRLNALAADCPRGIGVPYWLKYKHPLRSPLKADKYDFGDTLARDTNSRLKAGEKLSYEKCERNMLEALIDLRYEPSLRDFTDAEIRSVVQDNNWSFGVTQSDGSYKVYDDLLLDRGSGGMSLPTAYEVMKRSGYQVSGTPQHFSFQGADGHNCEFSDSYLSTLPCWYLKDGQRVPLDEYAAKRGDYCCHISLKLFKEMTGIECVYYARVEKKNSGR